MKKFSPRVEIRRQDNLSQRMPTVARSGDPNRLGNSRIIFDDTTTILFGLTQSISFPTTIASSSNYINEFITSSLFVTTTTRKGITDNIQWTTAEDTNVITPFNEHALHEQDIKTQQFYISGSTISDLGTLEFASNLGAKTQIRIRENIEVATQLQDQTASLYYYNVIHGMFEEVGQTILQNPGTCEGYAWDAKLFGPLGNLYASGSEINNYGTNGLQQGPKYAENTPLANGFEDGYYVDGYQGVADFIYTGSALLHTSYSANVSQSFNMSQYLTEPFLLEKAIIEFPVKCGPGWMEDYTRFQIGAQQDITNLAGTINYGTAQYRNNYGSIDYGGPAITVSLLRQTVNGGREVILSGTIIPHTDNTSSLIELYDATGLYDYNYNSGSGHVPPLQTVGFNSYSTPNFVISSSNSFFTGTVRIHAAAEISNGYFGAGTYGSMRYMPLVPMSNMNPFGRGQIGASPRAIFGREYISPTINNGPPNSHKPYPTFDVWSYPGLFDIVPAHNGNIHKYSPYLLYPGDKLVLAISKHRPVKTHALSLGITTNKTYDALTGSHDVAIDVGELNISLYGSHIKTGKEYHNTLNQLFSSDSISETVGLETDADQYEINKAIDYSGSYLDYVMSGTMDTTTRWYDFSDNYYSDVPRDPGDVDRGRETRGERVIMASSVSASGDWVATTGLYSHRFYKKYEKAGFNRFVQLASTNERFYDTLLPKLDDVDRVDGGAVVRMTDGTVTLAVIVLDFKVDVSDFQLAQWSNNEWTKSFPFEPKYSALKRQLDPVGILSTTAKWDATVPSFSNAALENVGNTVVIHQYSSASIPSSDPYPGPVLYGELADSGVGPPLKRETLRAVYGIGDFNTMYQYGDTAFGGATKMPAPRALSAGVAFNLQTPTIAEIRGWKYGILNGLEQFSKAIYRRDRFGQFRDRLEQRLDGKYYDTVGYTIDGKTGGVIGTLSSPIQVKFFDSNGSVVKPEQTRSSNLSFECTSSLPFFDGEVRNREEPLNASDLSSTIITL